MNDDSKPTIPIAEKPRDWHAVHLWQIQSIRDGLLILLIVGLIYLGDVLSIITVPLLGGQRGATQASHTARQGGSCHLELHRRTSNLTGR